MGIRRRSNFVISFIVLLLFSSFIYFFYFTGCKKLDVYVLIIGSLYGLWALISLNSNWDRYVKEGKIKEVLFKPNLSFYCFLVLYLLALSISVIAWFLFPENIHITQYLYFIQSGAFYFVFLKVGLFLFDIMGFFIILFWNDKTESKIKIWFIFIGLWIFVFLGFMLDSRWK